MFLIASELTLPVPFLRILNDNVKYSSASFKKALSNAFISALSLNCPYVFFKFNNSRLILLAANLVPLGNIFEDALGFRIKYLKSSFSVRCTNSDDSLPM